jgi:hypothetical protein
VEESSVGYGCNPVLRALLRNLLGSKNEWTLIIPMRVLIAEDDHALATFVQKGLEAEHYAVDVTHDGEQAKAMASELDYDLFMLDLNLPRMDGISILRHLRPRKPNADPCFDQQKPDGRPGAMPRPRRGRLHGETFLIHRALGEESAHCCEEATCRRRRYSPSRT